MQKQRQKQRQKRKQILKKNINNQINYTIINNYKYKKAFVLTHLGLGDNITAIGMVRYLSTCYDEVVVVCKNQNKNNVELFYKDDNNIKIYNVDDYKNISPNHKFDIKKFNKITNGYDLYLCGGANHLSRKKNNYNR